MAVQKEWVVKDPKPIKIDFEKIPKIELRLLCAATLKAVEKFYKDPENAKAFEAWQEERNSTKEKE